MGRKFIYNVIDANVKMATSIGHFAGGAWLEHYGSLAAVIKAAVIQELNPQYLPYEDCTWENLSFLLKDYPSVTYWYHVSHGNFEVTVPLPTNPHNKVKRTYVTINGSGGKKSPDIRLFSKLRKDYGSSVPGDYEDLGTVYEKCPSIAELGFEENPKLEYIRMYACYSAKYPDFAVAAGIINDDYDPLGERIYLGWKYSVPAGASEDANCYATFEAAWFYHQGVNNSVGQAFDNAVWDVPASLRPLLWTPWSPFTFWCGVCWNNKVWGADWDYFHFGQ